MTRRHVTNHKFVDTVPDVLDEGVVYISIPYATALHSCMCGCGNEVVTPLSPTGWCVTYDGKSVSLYPSIGNWSYDCQSHYWITRNQIEWAPMWTEDQIADGRRRADETRRRYYDATPGSVAAPTSSDAWPHLGRLRRMLRAIRRR